MPLIDAADGPHGALRRGVRPRPRCPGRGSSRRRASTTGTAPTRWSGPRPPTGSSCSPTCWRPRSGQQGRKVPRYPTGTAAEERPGRTPGSYASWCLRYGPQGTFWAENPTVPRVPVRQWQIWNEQMAPWFWSKRPWGPSYTQALKAAYQAIHRADRGATVVAGSFVAIADYSQWRGVKDLYRAGAKRYFDVIAVHPFSNVPNSVRASIDRMLEIVRRVRAEMRKRGRRSQADHHHRADLAGRDRKGAEAAAAGARDHRQRTEGAHEGGVQEARGRQAQAAHHPGVLVLVGHPVRRQVDASRMCPTASRA